ncbi:MAG: ABC transporter substrate-binding protein [Curvibacter sp. RIFCSPHIGHO2_12_FULL_63_18]|uniref:ABC transporter substrate-binding protein n=1 Tax=Rhodoferax sp. TaxID=50421 RepID=UPI0008C6B686|nr:ABC transporter substrate-binding protein [Rhodoferax sp.]OGO98239.1 MAG: ABC transporter substrate-binding protein [Curvibacter sp. GWA2_63_95]OGP06537.1 MAG: ABC transporter substrate-binding protein [Curvibacter sp. RIFCSPHIGHO2_12_FULL_63_18]HCX82924.1 ABC transporter substrate-binding protein [Rhodoferax sp.]
MDKRNFIRTAAVTALAASLGLAWAQDATFKIGLLLPLTGPFASTGKQLESAARLYIAQNGDTVGGKKVQLIVKDDTGVADVSKRLAQELVVNDKVNVLAGFGLTPLAMASATIATQSKTPLVVMAAATSSITEASPYIVRTSFTVPQVVTILADWAIKNNIRKVVTLVTDYAPGVDSETWFNQRFVAQGGVVVESLRVPLRSPDFAPFLQKVRDAKPDALFTFVPAGVGTALMKQFAERGMDKAGIRVIAEGSVTDDDILDGMGEVAMGVVTAHHYSAAHNSALNKKFVEAFGKANSGLRPNFMAVGAYDGMRVIYEAAKATQGGSGDALLQAMKGQSFESPRGPVSIDPQTRDVVHNIYVRKVEKVGGQLWNTEVQTFTAVKDPAKVGK